MVNSVLTTYASASAFASASALASLISIPEIIQIGLHILVSPS
jgi:hypothetical protein